MQWTLQAYPYAANFGWEQVDGHSVVEHDAQTRTHAFNEWELLPTRAGVALSLRTVRTRTHKLTMDLNSAAGELYDLVDDPHETRNLFDDKAAAAIKQQLIEYIHARPDDMLPLQTQVGMA